MSLIAVLLLATSCDRHDPAPEPAQQPTQLPTEKPTQLPTADRGSAAPSSAPPRLASDRAGARKLLLRFLEPGADTQALSRQLIPHAEDYAAVFVGPAAERARRAYRGPFDKGMLQLQPKPGQTELELHGATPAQLAALSGPAADFPRGYRRIADQLQPGVTIYRFSFRAPGGGLGMSYDGLVHVNGRWVMFPKPWRVLR